MGVEQSHGGYPSIQLALCKKYTELHQWEDAVRCITQYIRVSPDFDGYQNLAFVYKSQQMLTTFGFKPSRIFWQRRRKSRWSTHR